MTTDQRLTTIENNMLKFQEGQKQFQEGQKQLQEGQRQLQETVGRLAKVSGELAKQISDLKYWIQDEFQKFIVKANASNDKLVREVLGYRENQTIDRQRIEDLENIHPNGRHAPA